MENCRVNNNSTNKQQNIITINKQQTTNITSTIMPMTRRGLPTMLLQIPASKKHRRTSREQDDSSTSSTLTVEKQSCTKQEESTADNDATSSSRRSVSFCLAKNESFPNDVMCQEDVVELWYDNLEYKHFRASTMYTAKEVAKAESKNKAPFGYERVMANTYLACCKATTDQGDVLAADEFKHLVRWAEVATSRLGLEKWSIHSVGNDRSFRRSLMLDMVVEAQNNHQGDFITLEYYLADSCDTVSRPMRLFSRTLAEAQAVAARNALSKEIGSEGRQWF